MIIQKLIRMKNNSPTNIFLEADRTIIILKAKMLATEIVLWYLF